MMSPKEIQKLREWAPFPIVVTLILYFAPSFLIAPQVENLETTGKSFGSLLKTVNETLGQRGKDRLYRARFARMTQEMERLSKWLPPESYLPTLIDQFNSLAEILKVKIKTVVYGFPLAVPGGQPPRVDIRLNLEATYESMRSFIQSVESLPSPLVLTEVVANKDRTFSLSVQHLVKP